MTILENTTGEKLILSKDVNESRWRIQFLEVEYGEPHLS